SIFSAVVSAIPNKLCALMSFGDCSRIFRNTAIPGSICCCRINDRACSYVAGVVEDCAAEENSTDASSATMRQGLKNFDLTRSGYNSHPGKSSIEMRSNLTEKWQTEKWLSENKTIYPSILIFLSAIFLSGNALDQNSIFNPNWTFLAPKALVDLPKSGLEVSP